MRPLTRLFSRGPGRRRLPDAYGTATAKVAALEQRLAPLAGLVQVRCHVGEDHPEWWTKGVPGDCPWCLAVTFADEAAELRGILVNLGGDSSGGVDVPAAADLGGSCFCGPAPAPLPDFRITGDIPPGPVGCEAANPSAETQQTDVRALRAAMDATAVHPVAAVPPATVNPGPVHVTWTGGLSTRPPMPDEAPTERISAITAVMPIFDRSIPVVPAEVSPTAGDRAQASVLAAVGSPQ